MILTIPYEWQLQFNASDIEVRERMHIPVAPQIIEALSNHFSDFRKAYNEAGMTLSEFDPYGATVRILRGFIKSYHDLQAMLREGFLLPDPDVK